MLRKVNAQHDAPSDVYPRPPSDNVLRSTLSTRPWNDLVHLHRNGISCRILRSLSLSRDARVVCSIHMPLLPHYLQQMTVGEFFRGFLKVAAAIACLGRSEPT
jgi:hypothetical protein